jgi:hypothetical protein
MPLYPGFCGPSNPSQSVQADGERTVNWYLERIDSAAAPATVALYPTPGTTPLVVLPQGGVRAAWALGDRAFVVSGGGFYEITGSWGYTLRGSVALDANPATISYNGIAGGQLFITSGGNGYLYTLSTDTLTTVLTGEATMGGMINARFLAFNTTTGKVRMSALNDGATWDALLYFQRTLAADPWQAMVVAPPEIWLIGQTSGEVWYDAGAYPQPFAPIPGAFFEVGTIAPFSAGKASGAVMWLARTASGQGQVVAARGYVPQPISNFAVETAIGGYARTSRITDAELLTYEQDGHAFACWSFPSAGATWGFDAPMGAWHERGTWDSGNMRYQAWSPRVHGFLFGQHVVGGRDTGTLSALDVTVGSEGGTPIRRLRIPPPLWADSPRRGVVSRLEVMAEAGLGVASGQGSDPKVMLRTSPDGKTWGPERLASAGRMGEYGRRVFWNRLGSTTKLFVPEITVSDPIPWRLSGASVESSGFMGRSA